jgi:hypothetical protein
MNELSLLNDFVINIFQGNPLVNTITIVPTIEMDANKENIYPLVNIDLRESDIENDAVIASYKISVVQQRDVINQKTNNKLLTDSNYLDNMNETHSIINKFITYLNLQNNDSNIEIQSLTKLKPLKNVGLNGLDGFQFDIELSIYNNVRSGN